jgi:hypothetical protein
MAAPSPCRAQTALKKPYFVNSHMGRGLLR